MPGIVKIPYAALGVNGYYEITSSAKFAKNKNAKLQKICRFKKKTNCTAKLGKNKCQH